MGIGPTTLAKIIEHLDQIYCDSIGVEYMYIRDPEKVNWIQQRSTSIIITPPFQLSRRNIFEKAQSSSVF